jgi:transposase
MQRKGYSKAFKAQVAIAAIKGQKTANELASECAVHVSQINDGKKQALAGRPEVFSLRQHRDAEEREAECDRLYQQIGTLQVEVEWLNKTSGQLL